MATQGTARGFELVKGPAADRFQNYLNWLDSVGYRRLPDKDTIHADREAVLEGWVPTEPLIDKDTSVLALGGCFAAAFLDWLAAKGVISASIDPAVEVLIRNPLETIPVISQQFRWMFGEVDNDNLYWIRRTREYVVVTDDARVEMRRALEGADVLIMTLGHSEVWYQKDTAEPIWRALFEADAAAGFEFKAHTVAETVHHFEEIERLRSRYLPNLKIIYTVSPQRFSGTFRQFSPITANSVGKATIRAALDEFLRAHSDLLNRTYYYYPSYELALETMIDPFDTDGKHINDMARQYALSIFAKHYTTFEPDTDAVEAVVPTGLEAAVSDRDGRIRELQIAAQGMQEVIDTFRPTPIPPQHLLRRIAGAYGRRTLGANLRLAVRRIKKRRVASVR